MQQWWFDEIYFGSEFSVFIMFFHDFSLFSKVFITMHEYANYIICISYQVIKGMCLSCFTLVPSFVVYGE